MRTETLHSVSDYMTEAFNFIAFREGFRNGVPYFDSANPPRATIGYGFNIEVTDYLLLVLNELGIIDDTMTEAEITARRQAFTTEIKKTPDGDDDALAGNLDQVASTYGVSEFRLDFDATLRYSPQGYSIFENIILGLEFGPITIEGKQQKLDALLQNSLAHNSKEYVAVMSLYYNSEDLITSSTPGGSIADAVINDDRISAWYLIRYRRNGGDSRSQGIANRRYRESDLFGLWDNGGTTTTELEDFETFLKKMDPYSTNLSTLQLMRNYEAQYTSKTTEANNSRTIDEQINNEPAVRNYFISKYGQGENINGNIIIGTELSNKIITTTGAFASSAIKEGYLKSTDESDLILGEKGADLIDGGSGNDVIYGGEGNDQIIGGADNDILEGGAGDDKYYFQSGDGSDKINDSEGKNQIIWEDNNGNLHVEKTFYKTADAEWKSADGTTEVNQNSPYKMVFPDGTTVELGESISSFDINLKDVPANPTTSNEIIGDQDPEDKTDIIGDTPLNDRIEGITGNDGIWANNGGDNWLLGGSGNDVVVAYYGNGNDIIEGGSGIDIVIDGEGNDKIFGESYIEMQTHITQGETSPNIDAKGDLASGGAGDDYVYGSDREDALMGGEGSDLISGGAGDDVIMGDAALSATFIECSLVMDLPDDPSYAFYLLVHSSQRDGVSTYYPIFGMANYYAVAPDKWALKYSPTEGFTFRNIALEEKTGLDGKTYGGNDVIYAGAGNDTVFAGNGNDEVNAGPGNDIVFGQAGNDIISGGEGNDELQGKEGNDFIDGNSGQDDVFGGLGNDTLYGGEGNDYIEGNEGSDYVDAGAGDDSVYGDEGNDMLYGGDGNDIISGNAGNDVLDGGAGSDTISAGDGNDEAHGGDGNDLISGGSGNDMLYGGDGNDTLQGDEGDDYIDGGLGDDKLIGSGNDILVGGGGNDTYYYTDATGDNITIIDDFSDDSEDNTIDFGNGTNPGNYTYQWNDGNGTWTVKRYGPFETINPYGNLTMPNCHRNDDGSISGSVIFNGHVISFGEFLGSCYNQNEDDFNDATGAYTPPRRDPLILDLDGDGVETKRINTSTYFDHDANGLAERTGWVNKDDGLLAIDKNNDGKITDGNELFGDNTILKTGKKAANGFEALSEFDTNKDGVIDANDPIFNSLRVWQDVNEDAVSTPEELHDLNSLGIKAINLNSTIVNQPDANGNTIVRNGSFVYQDNTESTISEYGLQRNITHTADNNPVDVPEDIALLPDLEGSGKITSLQQAMAKDTSGRLKNLVSDLINSNDIATRNSLMEQILTVWTGTESVLFNSRGVFIDAKKLAVVEAFMGRPFTGFNGPNPNDAAAPILNEIYRRTSETYYAELMKQTQLKGLFENIVSYWDDTQYKMIIDLSSVAAVIKDEMANDAEKGKALLAEFARTYRATNDINTLGYLNFREEFVSSQPELGWIIDSGGLPVLNTPLGTNGSEAIKGMDNQNNYLIGNNGNDVIYGSSLNDSIVNGTGDAVLAGREGNDMISAGLGNDILDGGEGDDSLYGGSGNDIYIFRTGSGKDTVYDSDLTLNNRDAIYIGNFLSPDDISLRRNGNDLMLQMKDTDDKLTVQNWFRDESGTYQVERIQFSDGTAWDANVIKQLVLQGTESDDTLSGYNATGDTINGFGGNDKIYGMGGDDILDGGAGNDQLDGGLGNDTYLFNRGSGQDIIFDYDNTPGNTDTIQMASDILPTDTVLTRTGYDLYITINNTSDRLQIRNYFASDDYKIEQIQFSDGTAWDKEAVQLIVTTSTDTDDYLIGTPEADVIDGGKGNDTIYGLEGNDNLYGGTGDDQLYGGEGNDTLEGGEGNDNLYGDAGINTLKGGPGDDNIYYNNVTEDTYIVMDKGDGFDNVNIEVPGGGIVECATVQFGEGIIPENLSVQINSNEGTEYGGFVQLAIGGYAENEGMLIEASGYGGTIDINNIGVDRFKFADGRELTLDQIIAMADSGKIGYQEGTIGDDFLLGSVAEDEIYGGEGNDKIDSRDRNDMIDGGTGDDVIAAGPGNDEIYGYDGDDIMAGGHGNDLLSGESGNDVYAFNRGDGQDSIGNYTWTPNGETDTISFGNTINPQDITAYVDTEGNIVLTLTGTNDKVAVDWFDPYNNLEQYTDRGLLRAQFIDEAGRARVFDLTGTIAYLKTQLLAATADNPVLLFTAETAGYELMGLPIAGGDYAVAYAQTGDLFALPTYITGTDGNDFIKGREGNDTIYAANGNDVVTTGGGDDDITGGTGNDTLIGGTGNDTYRFNLGDGVDTINDQSTITEPNMIKFGPGITPDDIKLDHDPEAKLLLFNISTSGDQIKLNNFDRLNPYGPHAIEYFMFDNGQILTYSQMIDKGFDINRTNEEGNILGTATTDRILGGSGNDTLTSGTGNDTLTGGNGDDTYKYNKGDGILTIDDTATSALGGGNTLEFGEGITTADIANRLTFEGNTLIIRVGENGDEVHLTNFDPDHADTGPHAVEFYKFADGTLWSYSELVSNTFIIQGDYGDDPLRGTNLRDRLYGYEGSDVLNANSGDDTLTGGENNDELTGGEGDDTYVFNLGDGVDTIQDTATLEQGNRILFGQGITPDDVHTQINGTTLIIQYGNLGDEIRLLNFNYNNEHVIETIEFADGTQVRLTSLVDSATEGDDVIVGTYFNDVINAKGGNDQVTTLNGDDTVNGGSGNDTISTGEGEDTLTGGLGNDTLAGGDGYDTYYFNLGDGIDTINDLAVPGAGNRIIFGPGITLEMLKLTLDEQSGILRIQVGENGDALRLTNFNQQDAYGTHAVEAYQFNDGSYITYAELIGYGFDIVGTPQIDTLNGTNVNDRIWALESDDIITAGSGNDIINGGEGADTMTGGTGNDTYIVDNIGDIAAENTDEGTDIVQSSVTYMLADNIENLTLTGNSDINGSGNAIDNTIIGNSGNNILNGGAGADILTGGAGDDVYVVDNTGDLVTENPGEGIEQIQASITYTLGENIENLALTGIENIDGTGNSINNLIMGNSGNNLINGEAGNDILYGADGNDVINGGIGNDYIDGQSGDDTLNGGEGNDYVYGYTGNDLINGEAGDDILYGGPDNDTINGGIGNDYIEGEAGDDVLSGGEGNDYVYGYFGNDTINGDVGDDILYGGPDNDTINGGIGNDYLEGEAGDDVLNGSEGNDYVYGYIGNDTINGDLGDDILYGGEGNDIITGGIGNDYIEGEAGEDTLIGGTGNDYLAGYIGNDTYIFANGDGIDAINDCDTTTGNTDTVQFEANPLDIIFNRLGNDLNIQTNSTNDQVTVQNWYADSAYQTETIQTADGKHLHNNQVVQLIQAMATFCTTNGVTWNQAIEQKPAEVQQVLAQYWSQT